MPPVPPPPVARLNRPVSSPNATSRFRMLSINSPRSSPSPVSGVALGFSISTSPFELTITRPEFPPTDSERIWLSRIVTASACTMMFPESAPASPSEATRACSSSTSPPAMLTGPPVTRRVPLNVILPAGLAPRNPNACGGEAVKTLLSGSAARNAPSLPRLMRSRDDTVNAPSTSTFAFSPNRKPFGFIRYRLAPVMSDLMRPSISEIFPPVTRPRMLSMVSGPVNVAEPPVCTLNSVKL